MEKEIGTTGPTDFEEILILTRHIGNSVQKTSKSLNTFRHHATARKFFVTGVKDLSTSVKYMDSKVDFWFY